MPEIPSAALAQQNGINLGEMNTLLLKKIEELTLYVIDQARLIQTLQEDGRKYDEQDKRMLAIKRKLDSLVKK